MRPALKISSELSTHFILNPHRGARCRYPDSLLRFILGFNSNFTRNHSSVQLYWDSPFDTLNVSVAVLLVPATIRLVVPFCYRAGTDLHICKPGPGVPIPRVDRMAPPATVKSHNNNQSIIEIVGA